MSFTAPEEMWTRAIEQTRKRSPASFEQWFSSIQFDRFSDGILELTARDEFVRDWVKAHFIPDLLQNLATLQGLTTADPVKVEWHISSELIAPVCATPVRETTSHEPSSKDLWEEPFTAKSTNGANGTNGTAPSREVPRDAFSRSTDARSSAPLRTDPPSRVERRSERPSIVPSARQTLSAFLNPKYTFANFVVGPSNELAHAAALASGGGGGPRYSPLFICGGTGLGKTHLMHAIAHKVLEERPDARIVYVSAEHFTNEFIEALQHHRMDEFRQRYRMDCDLLLVDDIQFLAGREQTQEEFFHTFNALRDADKPIVVTSDKYPQQLQRMPERLVSRFTSGLVADIHVPQLETRVAIVLKKAHMEGILLSDDVAIMLAQSVRSNIRELEGALIRLAAKSSLTGRPIDEEFTRSEMALVSPQRPDPMSVEDIQRAVCSHFRLSNADLLSKDRHKSVAFARQVAMYLCRQRLKCSFPELGRAFGNRDHTTVMSAVRRVEALRQRDPEVNAHLQAIEQKLASSDDE